MSPELFLPYCWQRKMYIIENTVSDDARETAYEKVRRLILHDTEIYQKKAS